MFIIQSWQATVTKGKRSKNYYKTKKKIALCHEKIRNTRKDYLHKVSHEIISENQVIVSENLQIKNMVKNHHLAKAISDVSWYELTRQLEYKAKWNGREYVKIDTFYASSQLCSTLLCTLTVLSAHTTIHLLLILPDDDFLPYFLSVNFPKLSLGFRW